MNALDARVSLFERADRPRGRRAELTLRAVLDAVRRGEYAEAVAAVRAEPDATRRKALKLSRLPALAPSGRFERRDAGGLLEHSGVVVIDLDHAPDLAALRDDVTARPYVAAAFVSPSGDGLKAFVPVAVADAGSGLPRPPRDDAEHKAAWHAVAARFAAGPVPADPSGKDVARACYLSHDPDAYANETAERVFAYLPDVDKMERPARIERLAETQAPLRTACPEQPPERARIEEALACIGRSGRLDYPAWIKLIAAVLDAVRGDVDEAEALLIRHIGEETPGEYAAKLANPLGAVSAGSLFWLAERAGWDGGGHSHRTGSPAPLTGGDGQVSEGPPVLIVKPAAVWNAEAALRPIPRMLFDGLWYEGETTILFSSTNAGKSIVAVQVAESTAAGVAVPGFRLEALPAPVLYLDCELSDKQFERRYSADFRDHYPFSPDFHRAELNPDALLSEDWDAAVRDAIEAAVERDGFRRVIVDNLTYIGRQTEKGRDAIPLMQALHRMKRKHGLSLLVLAHTPKRDASRPITLNDLAGSAHLANFADGVFALGRSADDPQGRYVKQLKVRNGELEYHAENVVTGRLEKPHNFLRFAFTGYGDEADHLRERTDGEKGALDAAIVELHAAEPHLSNRKIAERLGTNHTRVGRALARMEQAGTGGTARSSVPLRSTPSPLTAPWDAEPDDGADLS